MVNCYRVFTDLCSACHLQHGNVGSVVGSLTYVILREKSGTKDLMNVSARCSVYACASMLECSKSALEADC